MDNEKLSQLKKEFLLIVVLAIALIAMSQAIFYKENIKNIIVLVSSIFWLFILPGYSIMFYWHKELTFLERIIIGFVIGLGLLGVISFYAGLAGLHTKYHGIILPLVVILLSVKFIILPSRQINNGS